MITIFDLDYTLFDTEAFRKKLSEISGLEFEYYQNSYKDNFSKLGKNYSFEEHLKILFEEKKAGEIFEIFKKLTEEEWKDFLFPGAIDLVKEEKARGKENVLITFGNKDFQKLKLSKLTKLTDEFEEKNIFTENEDKSKSEYFEVLLSEKKNEPILIINDNIKESIKMLDILGKNRCRLVIIESRHSTEDDFVRFSKEIQEYNIGIYNNINEFRENETKLYREFNLIPRVAKM